MKEVAALASRGIVDIWTVEPEFVPVQAYTVRLLHYLEIVYMDATLFEKFLKIIL